MFAMLIDSKAQMIGNAELCGTRWRGQVEGRPLEAWRGNLLTVARELSPAADRAIMVSEPIWLHGVVIC